jgi:hypothetical protein
LRGVSGKNFCKSGNAIIDHDRVGTDAQQAQSMIPLDVRFTPECVAKLPLRRLANRDSVDLRRASAGAAHDGATGRRTRPVLLFL